MSEYILTARCGSGMLFRTELFEQVKTTEQADMYELIDSGTDSALYEREWYSGWAVSSESGAAGCCLRRLYANGTEITLNGVPAQPFLMLYGFVQFQAEVTDAAGVSHFWKSKYCSALNSTDSRNIEQMIQQIVQIDDSVKNMLRWPSRSPQNDFAYREQEDTKYSMLTGFTFDQSHGKNGVPSVVHDIIAVYQKNAGYFRAKPEYTIRKEPTPVPYHYVKKLSRNSMLWSVKTGNLHKLPADSAVGIPIGTDRYMPRETLTEYSVKDLHIYENQVVIGFLDTVSRELKNQYWMEQKGNNDQGFDILRMILYPDAQFPPESLAEIERIRMQYQHSLQLEERTIPHVLSLPVQTKRFQEIPPYHEIYQQIYTWFRSGNSLTWGEGALFKGRLADKIYEYYCWLELLRTFSSKGFYKSRASLHTEYHGQRSRPPFSNIVFLQREQTNITLYYDPWIPNSHSNQKDLYGISLVRTVWEPGQEGYSPDFLIKVEKENHVSYAILDAKFRDMKKLFERNYQENDRMSVMEKCLQKYYINLSDQEHLCRPIKMLWLLQGRVVGGNAEDELKNSRSIEKGDANAKLDYYPNSYFNSLVWGAVPLNPQSANKWASHFWSVFEREFLL